MKNDSPLAGGTTLDPDARLLATIRALIDKDAYPFAESLEGFAAAAAAASMLNDWESSDDGEGHLTAEVKRSDVEDVITLLRAWAKTLTDTPAKDRA